MTNELDFQVFRRDGCYLVVAPDYGVVSRGANPIESLRDAIEKVEAVKQLYRDAGVEPVRSVCQPAAASGPWASRRDSLTTALVSGLIIGGLVLVATIPALSVASGLLSRVEGLATGTGSARIDEVGRKAVEAVVKLGAAMETMTPHRREMLRSAVGQIAKGLSPLVDEAYAARRPATQPAPQVP